MPVLSASAERSYSVMFRPAPIRGLKAVLKPLASSWSPHQNYLSYAPVYESTLQVSVFKPWLSPPKNPRQKPFVTKSQPR